MQQTRVPESFRQSQGFLTASAAAGETKEIHRWRGETEGEEDWQRVRNREALLKDGWGEWQGGRLEQRNRENLQGLVSFSWRKCPEEWRWKCEGCYVSKWDGRGRKGEAERQSDWVWVLTSGPWMSSRRKVKWNSAEQEEEFYQHHRSVVFTEKQFPVPLSSVLTSRWLHQSETVLVVLAFEFSLIVFDFRVVGEIRDQFQVPLRSVGTDGCGSEVVCTLEQRRKNDKVFCFVPGTVSLIQHWSRLVWILDQSWFFFACSHRTLSCRIFYPIRKLCCTSSTPVGYIITDSHFDFLQVHEQVLGKCPANQTVVHHGPKY